MKSVLISIRPKWCELIAKGEKTMEVRKTRPKLEEPFKVFIYCTLPPQDELFKHGGIREYANELIRLQSGEIVYSYGMRLCLDTENRPYSKDNFLCKKVIGEFICDNIVNPFFDSGFWIADNIVNESCLSPAEIRKYANGGNVYGWHISSLKIYEKPKPLESISVVDNKAVKNCTYRERIFNNPDLTNGDLLPGSYLCADKTDWCTACKTKAVTRPPQSWCYVMEE